MNTTNFQKGISLVETIVYVAIFSMFVIALTQFSTSLSSTRLHSQGVFEVNDQGSQAMKFITQTLRNGRLVNGPSLGNISASLSIDTGISGTNPTVLSMSGGAFYVAEGTNQPVALTNNKVTMSNLTFSNFSRPGTPPIIKISFTLTSTNARDPYSVNFEGSGAVRQ